MKKVLLSLFTLACYMATAQPGGNLDLSFNTTGIVVKDSGPLELFQDVKMQADDKIVAVGTVYDATYAASIVVSRFNTNGSYDNTFGTNGTFTYTLNYETGAYECYIKSNGQILVVGYTTDNGGMGMAMLLLQLNSDGTLDNNFGTNGVTYFDISSREDIAYGLAVQSDDKIVICGTTVDTSGVDYKYVPMLARFNSNGTQDTNFGVNGLALVPVNFAENDFTAVRIQSDGKIVAAGHIANGLLWYSALVARFNSDGTPDNTFGTNGVVNKNINNVDDEFFDLELVENKGIILTGFSVTQSDLYFHLLAMKLDSTGTPDAAFGTNGVVVLGTESMNVGNALEIQADGKIIIAGGALEAPPGNLDWGLWRLNPNGTPDADFGSNGRLTLDFNDQADEALGVVQQDNEKIVVVGKSRNIDIDLTIARFDDKLDYTLVNTTNAPQLAVYPNPVSNNLFINGLTQTATISIYNAAGALVASQQLNGTISMVNTGALSAGLYMAKVNTGNNQTSFKFIKE